MTINELHNIFGQLNHNLNKRQLKETFDLLRMIITNYQLNQYEFTIDNYYETYKNILKYSFELTEDPEKEKIYHHLIRSVYDLSDEIRETIIEKYRLLNSYKLKEEIKRNTSTYEYEALELIRNIIFKNELLEENDNKVYCIDDKIRTNLFMTVWFTDKFKESEIEILKSFSSSNVILWYDKALLVSALMLSIHRYFDANKIRLLFDFFELRENKVWQRAMVAIFTCILHYENRLSFYHDIEYKLIEIGKNSKLKADFENLIVQFIRSLETPKITKKINEEIMPEMIKMKSKIEEKLDLKNIVSASQMEDKNPDWENFFKDTPGVYDKIEQFSKLQLEGSDVLISAFANLKFFPFFSHFINWFIPFYKDNDTVKNVLKELGSDFKPEEFAESLERSVFMCDSDKYSFCFNIKFLPSAQKEMIKNLFTLELQAMNELAEDDEIINFSAQNKSIFTQYFQDLYRFYKLHPLKNEFYDIFSVPFELTNSFIFKHILEDKKVIRNIAEFYFEKGFYAEALNIFDKLSDHESDFELLEKIAYCNQKLGNYNKALEYYIKAELFDKNRQWILKKIGFCYKMAGKYKEAFNYYKEAEKLEPENLYILVNLGNICVDMSEFEEALKYYYKIEYISPDNIKIQRPIAWCSFVLGKFDAAVKYFNKIIALENNKNDYLNLGHVDWCIGNKKEAIKNYSEALKLSGNDYNWFSNEFWSDSQYLIKHGINPLDIPLMIDFIKLFNI